MSTVGWLFCSSSWHSQII